MSIGSALKRLRGQRGLTQEQLSKLTGIKVGHISKLEKNEGDPKLSTINKLISALKCSADELIFDEVEADLPQRLRFYISKLEKLPEAYQNIVVSIIRSLVITSEIDSLREDPISRSLGILGNIERLDDAENDMIIDEHMKQKAR
jgi:transcriptional regulator with XRE-family HTH domain